MTQAAPTASILATPEPKQGASQYLAVLTPGVAFCAAIASAAMLAGRSNWMQSHGLSPMILAMVAGIAIGNAFAGAVAGRCAKGVAFSKQTLLRLAIVLYGVRLTFADIGHVGMAGVLIDAALLTSTLMLALVAGRLMRMDGDTVLLIGAGSSICGAAAVVATGSVVKGKSEQVAVAVATVVLFGTLATFLYPFLYRLNLSWRILPASASAFGIYAGSTIHEVAQVIAAARLTDPAAVDAAVIAKMVRVMMLPFFLFAVALRRSLAPSMRRSGGKLTLSALPWFSVGFVCVVALNSLVPLAAPLREAAVGFDTLLLTMGMAALGLHTHFSCFKQAGTKAVVLAAMLFAWLIAGGAVINRIVPDLLRL